MKIKPFEEFQPMLASPVKDRPLRFPAYASPKVDGIRAVIRDGLVLSRNDLMVPNTYVQDMIGNSLLDGLDGELVVGPPNAKDVFQRTTSGVMSEDGSPAFTFFVFDYFQEDCQTTPFTERFARLNAQVARWQAERRFAHVVILRQVLIHTQEELDAFEAQCLADGFEGIMYRYAGEDCEGGYKFGRSTEREGLLLKIKKFSQSEALVIGWWPLVRQDGSTDYNLLGNLTCIGLEAPFENVEFSCGSGFTLHQRAQIWADLTGQPTQYTVESEYGPSTTACQPRPIGHAGKVVITFTHFPIGTVEKPRFPIFKGLRDPRDVPAMKGKL